MGDLKYAGRNRAWIDRAMKPALLLVLGLCIVRYWILPLPSSFWVDEMGSAFVVHYGASHPSFAAAPQVPASIYYVLPAAMEKVFGFSEISYRMPSLLLMGIAMLLVAQLARKLVHPDAGWFAVFACLSLRGINYQADDARPYALGTCVAAACLLCLIRWFDSGRLRDGLLFAFFAALVWRVHLIFWPFYPVLIAYALVRLRKDRQASGPKVSLGHAIAIFALIGILLIPVVLQAMEIARNAGSHVVAELPKFRDIYRQAHAGMIVGFLLAGSCLAYWLKWGVIKFKIPADTVVLSLGWWLCQPLLLFAYSRFTGNSVFVTRYLFLSLVGTGLVAASVVSLFLPQRFWKPLAIGVGIYVFLFIGEGWSLHPLHHNSNWRRVVQEINDLNLPPDTPVLAPSPFIEAQPPVWRPDYSLPSFFYSHVPVYPVRGSIIPLPFKISREAEEYAARLASGVLSQKPYFVIYGGDRNAWTWQWLMVQERELKDWQYFPLGHGNDVEAIVFVRPGSVIPRGITTKDQSRAF
jgi:hypothetical protein